MPSVHEVLLAVTGTSQEARRELAKVARDLAEFETSDATAELHIDAESVERQIADIRKRLATLDDVDTDIELRIQTDQAIASLHVLERAVRQFKADTSEGILPGGESGDFTAQQAALLASVRSVASHVERIQAQSAKRVTAIEAAELRRRESDAQESAQRTAGAVEVEIDASTFANADRALDVFEARLRSFADIDVEAEVQVQTEKALLDIDTVRARIRQLEDDSRGGRVRGDVLSRLLGDVGSAVRGAQTASRALEKLGDSALDATEQVFSFGKAFSGGLDQIGNFAGRTRDVQEAVSVLGFAIIATLIPALVALGASFGAAIAGAGALATAFAASLGPIVLLIVGVFQRLTKILEAKKATEQEAAQATNLAAEAAKQAEAAERARANALDQLRDARQGEAAADRALAQARIEAAEAIEKAYNDDIAAQSRVKTATQAVRDAFVSAHREMQDAAERVRDAILGVENAQLGVKEAKLATREAALELERFRAEAGLAGKQLDSTFKKFEDIDFDPQLKRGLLAGITSGAKDPKAAQLELERRILALQRAKLNEKNATDGLSDSQRDLTRARQDDAKFQQQGIGASETLTNAIRQQTEAVRASAEAHERYVELQGQGINGANAVVAAEDRLRDAHERVAAAQRALKDAGTAFDTMPAAVLKTKTAMDELSAAEQGFLGTLNTLLEHVKGALGPATDAIFGALGDAFSTIEPLVRQLGGVFDVVADQWADAIRSGAESIVAPAWQDALEAIFAGTAQLTGPILEGLGSLLEIFRDLAVASMPFLVELVQDLAEWLDKIAGNTSDIEGLRKTIAPLVDAFRAWLDLAGAVSQLLLAFFTSVGPAGTAFVRWIAEGARKLAEWMNSEEGRKRIAQFFRRVMPMARQVVGFIARMVPLFAQLIEAAAPVLEQMFRAFNLVLDVVTGLLNVLNSIPNPVFEIGGAFASIAFDAITAAVNLLIAAFEGVGDVVSMVAGLITGLFAQVMAVVKPIANAIIGIINGVINAINWVIGKVNSIPDIPTPFGDIGIPDIPEIPPIQALARGGLATTSTIAELGEKAKEAVLPLTRSVMADLANQIVMASPVLQGRAPAVALPGGSAGPGGVHIENVNLPPAPAAAVPDARYQAVQFAREIKRRGG